MDNRAHKRDRKRRKHLKKELKRAQKKLDSLCWQDRHMTFRHYQDEVYFIEKELALLDEVPGDPREWDDHEPDEAADADRIRKAARRKKMAALEPQPEQWASHKEAF